jgi:hypothetical protein
MNRQQYYDFYKDVTQKVPPKLYENAYAFSIRETGHLIGDDDSTRTLLELVRVNSELIAGEVLPGPFERDFYVQKNAATLGRLILCAQTIACAGFVLAAQEHLGTIDNAVHHGFDVSLKRAGYSSSTDAFENFKQFTILRFPVYPLFQVAMRILEKGRRCNNVRDDRSKCGNEPLMETYIDIANLGVIALAMLFESRKNFLKPSPGYVISQANTKLLEELSNYDWRTDPIKQEGRNYGPDSLND